MLFLLQAVKSEETSNEESFLSTEHAEYVLPHRAYNEREARLEPVEH